MDTQTESQQVQGLDNAPRILDMGTANGRVHGNISGTGSRTAVEPDPAEQDQYGFNFACDSRTFDTGAQRDSADGKPRPDLISSFATQRKARVMQLGAVKYGVRNWEKGMPLSVFLASAYRHLNQFMMGDMDEDHLAHCAFNLDAIMHGQEMIQRGLWPEHYDDLPDYSPRSHKGGRE